MTLQITPTDLRTAPLFHDLGDEPLNKLLAALKPVEVAAGELVFAAGTIPDRLALLVQGSLSVREGEDQCFLLKPISPVGELGSITGEIRNLSVVAAEPSTLLVASIEELQVLLQKEGELGFLVTRNLLRLSARKIGRDRRRQREMRDNIINTQKAMKRMREALLESEDSPLHAAIYEQLDALIEQNRKVHYLVEPSRLVPTYLRHDDGSLSRVTAISSEWLYFERPWGFSLADRTDWSGVLRLADSEMAVSGSVDHSTPTEVCIFLDELIPEYSSQLADHLTRAQVLDIVL
jgi:CRP/FNR family cyclic AMP-dependent transcriptional regulator